MTLPYPTRKRWLTYLLTREGVFGGVEQLSGVDCSHDDDSKSKHEELSSPTRCLMFAFTPWGVLFLLFHCDTTSWITNGFISATVFREKKKDGMIKLYSRSVVLRPSYFTSNLFISYFGMLYL